MLFILGNFDYVLVIFMGTVGIQHVRVLVLYSYSGGGQRRRESESLATPSVF